ncbi:DUF6671 family protein [Synechococcus sp. CBW1006]|uniref:DUF6671 family protein n=1 Tax=Synechococcus sp. CBW1006 TaxID=1353138 RepID=UPI0018CD1083|nr:DUF6671 family protein [Synechococcus sp. CBW1006]QPN67773.1 hypothetical protein H8F26_06440 [Synechococcus sp. CBW1006]
MVPASPYAGRRVCLTTLHGKERVLARPVFHGLGAELLVCGCDTDQLGTFSGEIERPADPVSTCRLKANLGLAATGLPLGLASEGSFGPHPAVPFLPVGQEVLVFVDLERQLTVVERRLEMRTTFSSRTVGPSDLNSTGFSTWLQQVRFPSHALIARPAQHDPSGRCIKAIRTIADLEVALAHCAATSSNGEVLLETDMRAHCNPTRMASIRRLGFQLVRRIRQLCPACESPGWGRTEAVAGLPCRCCGTATPLMAQERWGCSACCHSELKPRRDGRREADPMHCPWCNP